MYRVNELLSTRRQGVDGQAIGRGMLVAIGLSNRQRNLVLSSTALGLSLSVVTMLLRAFLFPTPEDTQTARVRNTLDRQFLPYAAVIETYALQNPALSESINKAEGCTRDYLKSLLSPAHPAIAAKEAAEATRACMMDQVIWNMRAGGDSDIKLAEQLAKVAVPMAASVAAVRR